ncbi:MAG: hypothetical protein R2695_05525 [Acidimicrobiales bacterium]
MDGDFRLRGRWDWATGVAHGEWVVVHALVAGPDFDARFALVPIADVTVDDVWYTAGMAATGSNSVVIDGAMVPADRTVGAADLLLGQIPVDGDGLAGLPTIAVLSLMASAPALGAAERAVELYRSQLAERVLTYTVGDRARPARRPDPPGDGDR